MIIQRCNLSFAATLIIVIASNLATTAGAWASEPIVKAVDAVQEPNGTFRFSVSVRHADTGWDHYAVIWQVIGDDGTVYGVRKLLHPHVDEQPFTRSQSGIMVPDAIKSVRVRAGDNSGDFGPPFAVDLPGR